MDQTENKDHANLYRVFIVGDSAGANIAHNLAVRSGCEPVRPGLNIVFMVLVHPYFEFDRPGKLWTYICPGSSGINDPRSNPGAEPGLLEKIVCGKVLVCIAEDDWLKSIGVKYYAILKNSNWNGDDPGDEEKDGSASLNTTVMVSLPLRLEYRKRSGVIANESIFACKIVLLCFFPLQDFISDHNRWERPEEIVWFVFWLRMLFWIIIVETKDMYTLRSIYEVARTQLRSHLAKETSWSIGAKIII
ncbi:Alpha/beta hydrolase fold-3 [Artemisia annua]|uniref:Alpha/beta hydrolase fold-3 n=1 Tax=Artemisia annua TaxID=35608 RepID=A0A2U1KXD6_ARTAN|nr:Alpha/beta hydrolase fold-3 [Artemisia annua]